MSAQSERHDLLHELASRGIRLTAQRRAVVDVIEEAANHLDADSLLALARRRQPNIDRATIYRTVDLLKRLRLIDELDLMHLEGEKHYYEVRTKPEHVHLACFRCGRIVEFSSNLFDELKADISERAGFDIRVIRLEAGGACRNCVASEAGARPALVPATDEK